MWQLLILKAMPLIVTLLLTGFLPPTLRKRTHDLAVTGLLLKEEKKPEDSESHDTLEYLLTWRDLITAVITGLFVLEFSVAEKIIEIITSNSPVTADHQVDWALVIIVTMVFILPLLLVAIWHLTDNLGLQSMQSKRTYWLLFAISVVPWYLASFLISYLL